MTDLRQPEAMLRNKIMQLFSKMIYRLQEHSLDVTLARAGVIKHDQVHAGSSLDYTATTSNSTSITTIRISIGVTIDIGISTTSSAISANILVAITINAMIAVVISRLTLN